MKTLSSTREKWSRNIISNLIIPLRLSQLFGLFPLSITRNANGQHNSQLRLPSFVFGWSIFLNAVNFVLIPTNSRGWLKLFDQDGGNFLNTIRILCSLLHHYILQIFYIFFLVRCQGFKDFYTSWNAIVPNLKFTKPQKKVHLFASSMSIFILAFGVLEHMMFLHTLQTTNMKDVGPYEPLRYVTDKTPLLSRLQKYFLVDLRPPYNFIALILILVKQSLMACMWNFVDVFFIVHSRAISFQFESLVQSATEIVADSAPEKLSFIWEEIRCEFEQLCGLLRKWNVVISTPLLSSYILNIILVSMHCSQWISSKGVEGGHGMTLYASITSSLLIIRTILVTHYGAEIHENAHGILALVDKCSSSTYSISLERLERKLAAQWIGVNAGGIFFVSRSLFASLTSVIFTIEIFLLQAGQPSQKS